MRPGDTAAIVRLCYAPDPSRDVEVRWRFRFFREEVLPRLLRQTVPTQVHVWVHPRHREEVERMGVATFTVDEGRGGGLRFQGTTLRGYPWSHVRGLPAYRYQVLLGSDDLLHPSMVEASLRAMEGHRRALASHLPIMVDVGRKPWRCYRMKAMPRPSPILVLKQDPLDARYTWVWSRDHRHLGRVVDRVAYIEEGYAAMGIHDHNDGTRISPRQPEIEVPPWLR